MSMVSAEVDVEVGADTAQPVQAGEVEMEVGADTAPPANSSSSDFAWESITYGVGKGNKSKEILPAPGLSGSITGGEMCALIGPSGAGKTSLLDVLAGRKSNKGAACRVGGTLTLGGQVLSGDELRQRIAFVPQEDLLYATQTPREALLFSAKLRLPTSIPLDKKKELVNAMISDLGLDSCADTYIGSSLMRGISGGEKKRTCVGVELVTRPTLIFLDEPTSGLDSFSAYNLMMKLRELTETQGCNVLSTIHQPSSEIFFAFHKVLLLRRGVQLYMGPVNLLSPGLSEAGYPVPKDYNPCDHVMNLLQSTFDDADLLGKVAVQLAEFCEAQKGRAGSERTSLSKSKTKALVEELSVHHKALNETSRKKRGTHAGWGTQLVCLSVREGQAFFRSRSTLIATFTIPVMLNLVFSLIFMGVGDTSKSTYNFFSEYGAITSLLISGMMGSAQPYLLRFALERSIFLKEYSVHTYGAIPYFIASNLVALPRSFIVSILVWLVAYWIVGFHGDWILLVLVYWLQGEAAAGTALLVGSMASNAETANLAGPAIFVPQMLFSGIFVQLNQIPEWLRWIQYISSLKYGANLFTIFNFGDADDFNDATNQGIEETLFEANQVDRDLWWLYLLILLVLFVAFRLLALGALIQKTNASF